MADTHVVPLGWHVGPDRAILLQQAEQWDEGSPFVVVMYKLWGKHQEDGLRLDLDKRVFLDSLDDANLNASLVSVAHELCAKVASQLRYPN